MKHSKRWYAFSLVSLLLAVPAFALPSLAPRVQDGEVQLGLFTDSYLNSATESLTDERTGNLWMWMGVRALGHDDDFHFGVDAEGLLGLRRTSYRYISINEAFAGYEKNGYSVYFGRKRYLWSELDSFWGLGLYQPRFRWDYLNEREQGLTGFFFSRESENVQFTAFASPIVIPEQGAPYDISGGNCTTSSPWFACPADTISIFNQPTDVKFSLAVPPVKDLVLHPSGGAVVRFGQPVGYFGRLAYAHKPMNQFLLSYEGQLSFTDYDIPAVIHPRVAYQDLTSADIGWMDSRNSITASTIWEVPHDQGVPSNWNLETVTPAFLYGLTVKSSPFEGTTFRRTHFEASYLHRNGGNGPDQGPFVTPGTNVFEPRYAFKNAFSLAVFTPIIDSWARTFFFTTRFVVDTLNKGNILQSDVYVRPLAATYVNFGVDILGSDSRDPVDFISRYQANDRLRAGMTYAF